MVRLNALGQSAIEIGEVRLCPAQPYLFAIALYLIVERGRKVSRQALVELIWPNVKDEKHARQRFRQNLLRLRECGLPVSGENGTLLLEKSAAHADFDALTSPDAIRPGQSLEFLPHYAPRISEHFLDWVDTHRSRVHANVQRIFLLRMQQARARGDWSEVETLASECLKLDPYNEEAVMAQAECAVMRGSKREALGILDTYMEALGSHVGTIGLPAKILRTRIAERLTDKRYAMISERHFVGRAQSMGFLLTLLREAQRGTGSAAFIWGEPGIGKSRLLQELAQIATLEGAQVVSAKCDATDAGRPLSAFADLVPKLKTLPGALGCSAQTFSLLQRLTERDKSETYPVQEPGDAAVLAASIRRAVLDLVDAVADEGMLVLVVEDLHWLDEASWAILRAMVEWSTTRSLLILMTSRTAHATETTRASDPDRGLRRLQLLALADADAEELIEKLALENSHVLPESVRAWSVPAAEGNPYYLRELLRHWLETQQTCGVPQSLAELTEARLNRLSSLALRVLQLCATFGKHSNFDRIERATGYRNHVLLDAIEELSNAAMLAADDTGVKVKHDLLASAATNRLTSAAAKLIHRQVAAAIETEVLEKHTPALMWDCAEHWQRAGENARALDILLQCVEYLYSVGQVERSIDLGERTLTVCSGEQERLHALGMLTTALRAAGNWSRLQEVIGEIQSLSERLGRGSGSHELTLLALETRWRLSQFPRTILADITALLQDRSLDVPSRLQAIQLGLVISSAEGSRETASQLMCGIETLENLGAPELMSHIKMIYEADFGDTDQALEHATRLLEQETTRGDPPSLSRARSNVASFFRRAGLIPQAKLLLHSDFEFAVAHELNGHATRAALNLALLALQEEDSADADLWYRRGNDHAKKAYEKPLADGLEAVAARIGLLRGDLRAAREYIDARRDADANHLSFRYRLTLAAIRFEVQLAEGGEMHHSEVREMAADFERFCGLGQCDFFATALYRALASIGERSRADELLSRYLANIRRDRGPIPPSLEAVRIGETGGR